MTNTQPRQDHSMTEETAQELMSKMGTLSQNMARFDERLISTVEKLQNQEKVNGDIEARMRLREKDAATLQGIVDWKKNVNGFFIAVGTAVTIAILVIGIRWFGGLP